MTARSDAVPQRAPEQVMRLERLGAFHASRLSFSRILLRRIAREKWHIKRLEWNVDADGWGHAVYQIDTGTDAGATQLYFYAFSNQLEPHERTDRVIAEKWDAAFTLSTAPPSPQTLSRLAQAVPRQEAGRLSAKELVLSRANKSVRFFEQTVERLARGVQPDEQQLGDIGYLMRTTAVYGNGKFGLADFGAPPADTLFRLPFQAEMLTVFLIRHFSVQLAEHLALAKSSEAACIEPATARRLGIGNATGLGMAPFLVNHPQLLHAWIDAREQALAMVRGRASADPARIERARTLMSGLIAYADSWQTPDSEQHQAIDRLREELREIREHWFATRSQRLTEPHPWDAFYNTVQARYQPETAELIVSMLLELYPELVDPFENATAVKEQWSYEPSMTVTALKGLIERSYAWALKVNFEDRTNQARFWYVSAAKQEPRLGNRYEEDGATLELPMDIARQVVTLYESLRETPLRSVGEFLVSNPSCRNAVRRVQTLHRLPYAEIQENLLAPDIRPLHMLRCKLATFGASGFDPKSDLWTRITLFQGAPLASEFGHHNAPSWDFFAP
ncbi:MAG: hypothetical protein K0U93_27005 [Gammaproteobacteria bacterium]|nr:hypothetical protein [Gammaproteobacteria bacterium]